MPRSFLTSYPKQSITNLMDSQQETELLVSEKLRRCMRHWVTGVAVVTSYYNGIAHGMTVNSFVSVSLDPPMVTVTMAHNTRTFGLVQQSGIFGVTILNRDQQEIAELFAGKIPEEGDRMTGLDLFTMDTGVPFLQGGIAFMDCRVVHQYPMPLSTLFIGKVLAAKEPDIYLPPLVYHNRNFTGLGE